MPKLFWIFSKNTNTNADANSNTKAEGQYVSWMIMTERHTQVHCGNAGPTFGKKQI